VGSDGQADIWYGLDERDGAPEVARGGHTEGGKARSKAATVTAELTVNFFKPRVHTT